MTDLDGALAVAASGLAKQYGATPAVQAIDLAIPNGQFFGLLGPNGAGKTTTIHMLSSLVAPSAGAARVAGFDLRLQRLQIRRRIGVVFQGLALDLSLSAAENLRFAGRLNGLRSTEIERRSGELLALFGLEQHRHAPVSALSGGMRRALDIARGVIHRPRILFLDEPTSGLDLLNRRAIWRHIADLRKLSGMTVFLTTHYLEEAADCDAVAFLNAGRIVQRGKPAELVDALGRCLIEVETDQPGEVARRLQPRLGAALIEPAQVSFACAQEPADLASLERELGGAARALRWRRPNLNDVFLRINQPHDRRCAA